MVEYFIINKHAENVIVVRNTKKLIYSCISHIEKKDSKIYCTTEKFKLGYMPIYISWIGCKKMSTVETVDSPILSTCLSVAWLAIETVVIRRVCPCVSN